MYGDYGLSLLLITHSGGSDAGSGRGVGGEGEGDAFTAVTMPDEMAWPSMADGVDAVQRARTAHRAGRLHCIMGYGSLPCMARSSIVWPYGPMACHPCKLV